MWTMRSLWALRLSCGGQSLHSSQAKAKKAKVLPEPQRSVVALISVSVALSQTPAEAASPGYGSSVSRGVPV